MRSGSVIQTHELKKDMITIKSKTTPLQNVVHVKIRCIPQIKDDMKIADPLFVREWKTQTDRKLKANKKKLIVK